jgi:anthranilate synthase component 1
MRDEGATLADAIDVGIESIEIPFADAYDVYLALRDTFGAQKVFLLESLAGPAKDSQSALVGVLPVLTIDIQRTAISLGGEAALAERLASDLLARRVAVRDGERLSIAAGVQVWDVLRAVQAAFRLSRDGARSSYVFGYFGYFGYDTARFIEKLPYKIKDDGDRPEISLALFQAVVSFDLAKRSARLIRARSSFWPSAPGDAVARLLSSVPLTQGSDGVPPVPRPDHVAGTISRAHYLEIVKRALHHVGIGDIYQVQLGHELHIRSTADPLTVYRRLRARNPSPYMYLAQLGRQTLIGASPELFLRISDGVITMRPLAGTARRGQGEQEDAAAAARLRSDVKEVAEHIMLVDLCRNDIGRVCEPGTLDVDELLVIEKYSTVFHLVSNVLGRLAPRRDVYDVIAATFPAGTMTGAPKIRATEIIEDLETTRRGIYAGAIGVIDFSGYANLALCIRTAVHSEGQYVIRASAGTVADSDPEYEWRETIAKLNATYWAIAGEEYVG